MVERVVLDREGSSLGAFPGGENIGWVRANLRSDGQRHYVLFSNVSDTTYFSDDCTHSCWCIDASWHQERGFLPQQHQQQQLLLSEVVYRAPHKPCVGLHEIIYRVLYATVSRSTVLSRSTKSPATIPRKAILLGRTAVPGTALQICNSYCTAVSFGYRWIDLSRKHIIPCLSLCKYQIRYVATIPTSHTLVYSGPLQIGMLF